MIDVQLGVNDDDPKTINIVLPNRYEDRFATSEKFMSYLCIVNQRII